MPDLPDDRQAMTDLQHQVHRFRAIFDEVSESIALLKPDGNLIEVNLTAAKSLGIEAEAASGLPFWSAACWNFTSAVQQQLQASIALAAQGASIRYETEVMGTDNRLFSLYFSLTPIRDSQGEIVLILVRGRDLRTHACLQSEHSPDRFYSERRAVAIRVADITERKQLELINQAQLVELQQLDLALMLTQQQLSKRDEKLDRCGTIVAHDFTAQLRAIANLSEWIEEDLSDRILDDERPIFQLLRQRVKRLDALVDELLNYLRLGR